MYLFFESSPEDTSIDCRQRKGETERGGDEHGHEREASTTCLWEAPAVDHAHSLSLCPDQEWTPRPFRLWEDTPTTPSRAIMYSFVSNCQCPWLWDFLEARTKPSYLRFSRLAQCFAQKKKIITKSKIIAWSILPLTRRSTIIKFLVDLKYGFLKVIFILHSTSQNKFT